MLSVAMHISSNFDYKPWAGAVASSSAGIYAKARRKNSRLAAASFSNEPRPSIEIPPA
jgi:hypothetical protein